MSSNENLAYPSELRFLSIFLHSVIEEKSSLEFLSYYKVIKMILVLYSTDSVQFNCFNSSLL